MNPRRVIQLIVTGLLLVVPWGFMPHASSQTTIKQGKPVPANFCIDANEMELYKSINEYRKRYDLPPIPLSKSLSYVAALHAKDLFLHHPDQGSCNFHSWSGRGFWTPFCYPRDENKKNSVWDKPREITKYPSRGHEIVYWENNPLVADTVMMVWIMEEYFNSFLLNTGKWQGTTWNAIGLAVYENYACAWFGEAPDPVGTITVCGTVPEPMAKDTLKNRVKPVVKPSIKPKKPKVTPVNLNKKDTLAKVSVDTLTNILADSVARSTGNTQPKDSLSYTYYIIVNSTLTRDGANKLAETLKSKGYPDAKMVEKNGKIRISIIESKDRTAILQKLKEVKKTYRDAWLLKITNDK